MKVILERSRLKEAKRILENYGVHFRNETDGGVSCGAPKPTNEDSGCIKRKQAIVVKRGAAIDISQDLIGNSPNTSKTHTGKMQRGASRARRQMPIGATEKI